MPINQLFSKKPDNNILEKILTCFNLKSLQEEKQFTKKILKNFNTVKQIEQITDKLKEFYILLSTEFF